MKVRMSFLCKGEQGANDSETRQRAMRVFGSVDTSFNIIYIMRSTMCGAAYVKSIS
jgi:hypothetical protein